MQKNKDKNEETKSKEKALAAYSTEFKVGDTYVIKLDIRQVIQSVQRTKMKEGLTRIPKKLRKVTDFFWRNVLTAER